MQRISEFLVGLLFGVGLMLSGMTDPGKVIGFLDITGHWDPSLALVMTGAIGAGSLAFAAAKKRSHSWLGQDFDWPASEHIDRRVVLGSLVFGVGWGLAGFCPGPAWVSLAAGQEKAFYFVGSMIFGMIAYESIQRFYPPSSLTESPP
ncbi:DUF6691 family protein [Limnohabitans sp.]|uniref:DUF6691 family protein n=1 Tax=Limnohabitans sp. TaxID=1907725 RepID=UPI0038B732F4